MLERPYTRFPSQESDLQDTSEPSTREFLQGLVETAKVWETLTPEEKQNARLTYGPFLFSVVGFGTAFAGAVVARIN